MMKKTCRNCLFFHGSRSRCRRFPPLDSNAGRANFPFVQADDWCGEWKIDDGPLVERSAGPKGLSPGKRRLVRTARDSARNQ